MYNIFIFPLSPFLESSVFPLTHQKLFTSEKNSRITVVMNWLHMSTAHTFYCQYGWALYNRLSTTLCNIVPYLSRIIPGAPLKSMGLPEISRITWHVCLATDSMSNHIGPHQWVTGVPWYWQRWHQWRPGVGIVTTLSSLWIVKIRRKTWCSHKICVHFSSLWEIQHCAAWLS